MFNHQRGRGQSKLCVWHRCCCSQEGKKCTRYRVRGLKAGQKQEPGSFLKGSGPKVDPNTTGPISFILLLRKSQGFRRSFPTQIMDNNQASLWKDSCSCSQHRPVNQLQARWWLVVVRNSAWRSPLNTKTTVSLEAVVPKCQEAFCPLED